MTRRRDILCRGCLRDCDYLDIVRATGSSSWDRFAANLAWRHGLKSAVVLGDVPGWGRVVGSGAVLVVDGGESIPLSDATPPVFGEWVQEVCKREPSRNAIQMVWGKAIMLIYTTATGEIRARRPPRTEGGDQRRVIANAVSPDGIASLTFDESLPASL